MYFGYSFAKTIWDNLKFKKKLVIEKVQNTSKRMKLLLIDQ